MNPDNIVGDWRTVSQYPDQEFTGDLADRRLRFLLTLLESQTKPEDKISFIAKQLNEALADGSYYDLESRLSRAIKSINTLD